MLNGPLDVSPVSFVYDPLVYRGDIYNILTSRHTDCAVTALIDLFAKRSMYELTRSAILPVMVCMFTLFDLDSEATKHDQEMFS